MKRALITGVTGQDGSYLAELLLRRGYEVHGLVRRASTFNRKRIDHLRDDPETRRRFHLHYGDLGDSESLMTVLAAARPDEVYNLAAQSHVGISFSMPTYTGEVSGLGTIRLLEAVRAVVPEARFYQASTSELFGKAEETPQSERTPFHPRSPYAVSKLYSFWATVNYREAYGMFAVNGILFNHESPRRGENFVTRKVTRAVAEIVAGRRESVALGNLEARRDDSPSPNAVDPTQVAYVTIYRFNDNREYAFVEQYDGSVVPCEASGTGGDLVVSCNNPGDGRLTVRENSWSGWYAWRDGRRIELLHGQWLRVDALAGEHTYRFRYLPWDVPLGLAFFVVGVVLTIREWRRPR